MLINLFEQLATVLDYDRRYLRISIQSFDQNNNKTIFQLLPYLEDECKRIRHHAPFIVKKIGDTNDMSGPDILHLFYESILEHIYFTKRIIRTSNGSPVFTSVRFDCYWLNLLFDVEELATDTQGLYKIVRFSSKTGGTPFESCFKRDTLHECWIVQNPKDKEFIPLFQKLNPVTLILVEFTNDADITFDMVKGQINLPAKGTNHYVFRTHDIIEQTTDSIKIDLLEIKGQSNDGMVCSHTYVHAYIKDSTLEVYREELPPPDWFHQVRGPEDFIKNPHNKFIHDIIPAGYDPVFEGKNLFITHWKDMYVNVQGTWIMADKRWLISHRKDLPGLAEDLLAIQLAGIDWLVF